MSAMLAQSPNPVLRRENSDTDNKGTVPETATCDWPTVIYKLVEQFGMDSDPFKRHYVRELYSAGLDEIAKQVRIFVSAVQLLQSWKNSQQFSRKENLSRVRKEFHLNHLLGKFSMASWSCLKLGKSLFGQKKLLRNIYQAARLNGERVGLAIPPLDGNILILRGLRGVKRLASLTACHVR